MPNINSHDSPDEHGDGCTHYNISEDFRLTITRNEALYLDDCLTLMVEREISTDQKNILGTLRNVAPVAPLPVPIELVDKIGFAVLSITDEDYPFDTATLKLDSSELYLLREVAQSYVKVGEEAVGFNLKKKIYKALYEEEYEQEKTIDKLLLEALPDDDIHRDTIQYKTKRQQ